MKTNSRIAFTLKGSVGEIVTFWWNPPSWVHASSQVLTCLPPPLGSCVGEWLAGYHERAAVRASWILSSGILHGHADVGSLIYKIVRMGLENAWLAFPSSK